MTYLNIHIRLVRTAKLECNVRETNRTTGAVTQNVLLEHALKEISACIHLHLRRSSFQSQL